MLPGSIRNLDAPTVSEVNLEKHLPFAQRHSSVIDDNLNILANAWFSDEAHFHLDGYVNELMKMEVTSDITYFEQ